MPEYRELQYSHVCWRQVNLQELWLQEEDDDRDGLLRRDWTRACLNEDWKGRFLQKEINKICDETDDADAPLAIIILYYNK